MLLLFVTRWWKHRENHNKENEPKQLVSKRWSRNEIIVFLYYVLHYTISEHVISTEGATLHVKIVVCLCNSYLHCKIWDRTPIPLLVVSCLLFIFLNITPYCYIIYFMSFIVVVCYFYCPPNYMLTDVMYYAEWYVYKLLVKAFSFTLDGYTWIHPRFLWESYFSIASSLCSVL